MNDRKLPSEGTTIHFTELAEATADEPLSREWNTYRREVGQLLAEGREGQFVLIKDESVVGVFDREDLALAEGYHRFLDQSFFVHQIREREPILHMRGRNLPWLNSPTPLARPA